MGELQELNRLWTGLKFNGHAFDHRDCRFRSRQRIFLCDTLMEQSV